MRREFTPKSILYLRSGYNFHIFKKDLLAGITVGIIALPLAMAFAIASGTPPERGIITAIIAGFLISALGGSKYQIGGPTGAFVVVIYSIIQRTGYDGLAISTLIGAGFLILLGLFKLGSWIKYVPHPLVTGFTSAIAIIIFSSQLKDFFGLKIQTLPPSFIDKWIVYAESFSSIHWPTLSLGMATLALIVCVRKFFPKIPYAITAIIFATLCSAFFDLPVATIQSTFGALPRALPLPSLPAFHVSQAALPEIFMDGITIAFLAGIESLLSAVIADGLTGSRHKSNCELVGQGIANIGSILFGGIPATGAIARTAANIKSGAQTPLAGMIHAITLFLIIFLFAGQVSQIPLCALAAVLIMVSWHMSEIGHFIRLFKAPKSDIAILLTAFLLTLFVDITIAITFGMILASFLFMKRMSEFSKTIELTSLSQEPSSEFPEKYDPDAIAKKKIPEGTQVYELQGPFFFAVADILNRLLLTSSKVLILRMRYISMIDASGMHALKEFHLRCQKNGTVLLLSGIGDQIEKDLTKFGITKLVGKDHIFPHIDAALTKAAKILLR